MRQATEVHRASPEVDQYDKLESEGFSSKRSLGLGKLASLFAAFVLSTSLGSEIGAQNRPERPASSPSENLPPIPKNYNPESEAGARAFLAHHGVKPEDLKILPTEDASGNISFSVVVKEKREFVSFSEKVDSKKWDLRGGSAIALKPGADASEWYADIQNNNGVRRTVPFEELKDRFDRSRFFVSIELFGRDSEGVQFYIGTGVLKPQQFTVRELSRLKEEKSEAETPAREQVDTEKQEPNATLKYVWPGLAHVWVGHGEDKVTQEELRAEVEDQRNSLWNGRQVSLQAARNEVVAFNLVLEAPEGVAKDVTVELPKLQNKARKYTIDSRETKGDGLFDYRNRPIELFVVDYLEIKGLSRVGWETYDERHIPERMRRPYSGEGFGAGSWSDRPDANRHYPDIAVPIEAKGKFSIQPGASQSVWVDVFVPVDAPSGKYQGEIEVRENGKQWKKIPVELTVMDFTLPLEPAVNTVIHIGQGEVKRHLGIQEPSTDKEWDQARELRDKYFQMLHRHGLMGIGDDARAWASGGGHPSEDWIPRLSGDLFTPRHHYEGLGQGVPNDVYSVGTYGTWNWKNFDLSTPAGVEQARSAMWKRTDEWMKWFAKYAPDAEVFLYLADESDDFTSLESWARFMNENPGIGRSMKSFATISLPDAQHHVPGLDIAATQAGAAGILDEWMEAASYFRDHPEKELYYYNGVRPRSGTLLTEDDGVSPRMIPLVVERMALDGWFYWESTYYNNYQGGTGETNVFEQAQTFGGNSADNGELGRNGWNYSNGDGVLFYPGTDTVFPEESLGLPGPIASIRLKLLRRGMLDAAYVKLAEEKDPKATADILRTLLPKVLWEMGVSDQEDPTWLRSDISWSNDPEVWEDARKKLAKIITR
ncbi:MAG: DUF4091 domain-containing protein [Bdellovibrionales bacterium]|nr:DUF4091 domain-containing protein [Bdellovibrionales bacterium]